MPPLVADYPILRWGILLGLFALVAIGAYFTTVAVAARQLSRRRLVDGSDMGAHAVVGTSLRSQQQETAWVKLVNGIEKADDEHQPDQGVHSRCVGRRVAGRGELLAHRVVARVDKGQAGLLDAIDEFHPGSFLLLAAK